MSTKLTGRQEAYLEALVAAGAEVQWVNLEDVKTRLVGGDRVANSTHYNNLKRLRLKLRGRLETHKWRGYRLRDEARKEL